MWFSSIYSGSKFADKNNPQEVLRSHNSMCGPQIAWVCRGMDSAAAQFGPQFQFSFCGRTIHVRSALQARLQSWSFCTLAELFWILVSADRVLRPHKLCAVCTSLHSISELRQYFYGCKENSTVRTCFCGCRNTSVGRTFGLLRPFLSCELEHSFLSWVSSF